MWRSTIVDCSLYSEESSSSSYSRRILIDRLPGIAYLTGRTLFDYNENKVLTVRKTIT
jgi:hypothetical protein